jgi:uncharacterized protein (DUF58 family)
MTVLIKSRFLDLRALAALAHLRFTTRQRTEGQFGGRHVSRRQGGAGEFLDFREYTGADDLRRVDWKVLARTGKAFVRLHQDETNLRTLLAIDVSGSMAYGQRHGSKLAYVQHLATALSHVISSTQDQVGLAVLGRSLETYIPPGSTPNHIARVQETIESLAVLPTSAMSQALRDLFAQSSRRGVLLVLSDFLMDDLQEVFAALRLFRHRGFEVIVLHVVHPEEERLPPGMALRFADMEGGGHVDCSPAEIQTAYERRLAEHLARVRQLALVGGCDYRFASVAVPYLQTLHGFLVERAG